MVGIAKSTTASTHMTTPCSVWLTKKILQTPHKTTQQAAQLIGRPAIWAVEPHHPYHASEPNGAKWSPHKISKPDKIAI